MWFKQYDTYIELFVFVKSNAKKTKIVAKDEQSLHVAIHAKPQEGEANQELIRYLAKEMAVPKTKVQLYRGEHSRYKTLRVPLSEFVLKWLTMSIV